MTHAINKLTLALAAPTADEAARIIQDALDITDGGVASLFFTEEWPVEFGKRAAIIAKWLSAELSYALPSWDANARDLAALGARQ